jgi:hypothetical protein
MSVKEKERLEEACLSNDLHVACGFMKPGKQQLIIIDNILVNGRLELVCYKKEILIQEMKGQLNPVLALQEAEIEENLKIALNRYNDIQLQIE